MNLAMLLFAIIIIGMAFAIWYALYPEKVKSWYFGLMKFF